MNKKLKIKVQRPWIGYCGSTVQQNYAEELSHGYLLWDIKNKDDFDVTFRELPNPQPYVTVDWGGDVESTLCVARSLPKGSRFRVRANELITQKDAVELATSLRKDLGATEVTFKIDQAVQQQQRLATDLALIDRGDLRNVDVLVKLLRDFHETVPVDEEEWQAVHEQVASYAARVADDGLARGTKWTLKHLQFDNVFSYGDGNVINFGALSGIVGIFGPNRAGKSSIPGTIMYSLFNATDRGSVKNLHICNVRKPYCYSRAIFEVNGIDYVIERQTTKNENRRGDVNASTSLNFFRLDDGEAIDLAGEQRADTDKLVRQMIGTYDDFLLTSLAAQGDMNQYIQQGSSKRRQALVKFLDLDVFDQMYDFAKTDVNTMRALLKQLPDKNWEAELAINQLETKKCDEQIEEKVFKLSEAHEKLSALRAELAVHRDVVPVSTVQVDQHHARVLQLERKLTERQQRLESLGVEIASLQVASVGPADEEDIGVLQQRLQGFHAVRSKVQTSQHKYERFSSDLKQQRRTLKILDEVPCGDMFPTCKFIKDAHAARQTISDKETQINQLEADLKRVKDELAVHGEGQQLSARIEELRQLEQARHAAAIHASGLQVERVKEESSLTAIIEELEVARARLAELEEAVSNEENIEVVGLRSEIDRLQINMTSIDREKLSLASRRGVLQSEMEVLNREMSNYSKALKQLKIYELVASGFSRKGVPSAVLSLQLPLINAEIVKILNGIVDFTVELECDDDNDQLEMYINYGDSRRIIELGSGMEKMIWSIALRTALISVSTLPKSDIFIIDEGFGALDDGGIEACSRLLESLKKYFRVVMVITHVDSIKDIVDHVLEITKNEKDAKVVCS